MHRFTLPFPPFPKERPRRNKTGQYYTPSATKQAERQIREFLHLHWKIPPILHSIGVALEFYVQKQSGDLDNYVKLVLDAGNLVLWKDDRQIKRLEAQIHPVVPEKWPHTLLAVEELA